MNSHASVNPPRTFPVILFLIATPLVLGGLQLVILGGSFYYLLAGLVLVASGYRLWHADPTGSLVYGGLLIATVAWALMESGTNLWALAPRILPFAAIGLWFLTPWLRRSLYGGTPPPLFVSTVSKGTAALVAIITVFVFISGSGFDAGATSASVSAATTASPDLPTHKVSLGDITRSTTSTSRKSEIPICN